MSCEDSDAYELAIVTDNEDMESEQETAIKKINPYNDSKLYVINGNCQGTDNFNNLNHCQNKLTNDFDDVCDDELIKLYDEKAKLIKEVENAFKEELLSSVISESTSSKINLDLISNQSSEDYEQCPICLIQFLDQEIASPNNCNHSYCLECLIEWSKNVTTCPIDRIPFEYIFARHSYEGTVFKKIEVQKKDGSEFELVDESLNTTLCQICHLGDREESLLLCDICDNGYHMECLTPPLTTVPIEEWFCPLCDGRQMDQSEDELILSSRIRNGGPAVIMTSDNLSPSEGSEDSDLETSMDKQRYLTRTSGGRAKVPISIPRTRAAERVRARIISNRRRKISENVDYGDQKPGPSQLTSRPGPISVPPPALGMDELLEALRRRRKAAALKRKNGNCRGKISFKKRKSRARKLRKRAGRHKKRGRRKGKPFKRYHLKKTVHNFKTESESRDSHGFSKGKDDFSKLDRRRHKENLKVKGGSLSPLFTPPPTPSPPSVVKTFAKSPIKNPAINHQETAPTRVKDKGTIDLLGNIFEDQSKMLTIRGDGRSFRVATDGTVHYSPKTAKIHSNKIGNEKNAFSNIDKKTLIPASTIHRPPFKHKTLQDNYSSHSHTKNSLPTAHPISSKIKGGASEDNDRKRLNSTTPKSRKSSSRVSATYTQNDDHNRDSKSRNKVIADKSNKSSRPTRPIRSAASWALEEEAELETPFQARLAASELSVSYHSICPLHIKLETIFPDPLYTKTLPGIKKPQSKRSNMPIVTPVSNSSTKIGKVVGKSQRHNTHTHKEISTRSRAISPQRDEKRINREKSKHANNDRRESSSHHSKRHSSGSRSRNKEIPRHYEGGKGGHKARSNGPSRGSKTKTAKTHESNRTAKSPATSREEPDDLEIIEVLKAPPPNTRTSVECITLEEDDNGPDTVVSNSKSPPTFSQMSETPLANIPLPYDPFDPTPVSPTPVSNANSPPMYFLPPESPVLPLLPPPPIPCFIPPPPAFLIAAKQNEIRALMAPPSLLNTADPPTTPMSQTLSPPNFYPAPSLGNSNHLLLANHENLSIPLPDFLPSCPPPPPFPVLQRPSLPITSASITNLNSLIPLPKAQGKTVLSLKVQGRQAGPPRASLFDSSDEETGEKTRFNDLGIPFNTAIDAHVPVNTMSASANLLLYSGPDGSNDTREERRNNGTQEQLVHPQETLEIEPPVKPKALMAKVEACTDLNSTIAEISRIILKAPVVDSGKSRTSSSKRDKNSRDKRGREKLITKHSRRSSKDRKARNSPSSSAKHHHSKHKKVEDARKSVKDERTLASKKSTHKPHSHRKSDDKSSRTSHHHHEGSKTEREVKGSKAKEVDKNKKDSVLTSPQTPRKKLKIGHPPKVTNRKSSPIGKGLASTTLLSLLGSVQKLTLPAPPSPPYNGKNDTVLVTLKEMKNTSPTSVSKPFPFNNGFSPLKQQSTSKSQFASTPRLDFKPSIGTAELDNVECHDHNETPSLTGYSDPHRGDVLGQESGSGDDMEYPSNLEGRQTFGEPVATDEIPNSAMDMIRREKYFQKLNHQQRVAEEVKVSLKPFFSRGEITKQQYKDIMRRAVNKICGSKSGKIKPLKILSLVQAYVKLYVKKS